MPSEKGMNEMKKTEHNTQDPFFSVLKKATISMSWQLQVVRME
jgi:hypothetical protein